MVSYNRPELCANVVWNSSATTFANASAVGTVVASVFVDTNDGVYVAAKSLNVTEILFSNSTSSKNVSIPIPAPLSIFVTSNGDIYVASENATLVQKFLSKNNYTSPVAALQITSTCFDVFVDVYDNVYCSMIDQHQVVRRFFYDDLNVTTAVGGNGINGSTSDLLSSPRGIFVTKEFDLYVADCGNNRVQHFLNGQRNASTIIGNGTMTLNCPSGITLDAAENVFVADFRNNRILRWGPNGVACIAGCTGTNGSASGELFYPRSLSFDSVGNLFVVGYLNSSIHKFIKTCNPSEFGRAEYGDTNIFDVKFDYLSLADAFRMYNQRYPSQTSFSRARDKWTDQKSGVRFLSEYDSKAVANNSLRR